MRPTTLTVGTVQRWTITTLDPTTLQPVNADSNPSVTVRREGSEVGDAVTVIKRPSTTALYDCTYDPSAEFSGEKFLIEEVATIGGIQHPLRWSFEVIDNASSNSARMATDIEGESNDWDLGLNTLSLRVNNYLDANSTQLNALTTRLSAARAGYLDKLNVTGNVASQADINAINQSASRRIILQTVGQYERPESGSTVYTVEARTFDGDGAPVNADANPTLTATGQTTGSLNANIGGITNPATGVYRWTYTVASGATLEPVRFDASATIGATAFPMAVYSQVVDFVSATWTTTNASNLTAIFNKLPSSTFLAGTGNANGSLQMNNATGNFPGTVAGIAGSITTLDGLNTSQNAQHATTQSTLTTVSTNVSTLLGRITSTLFAGITSLRSWLGILAGKTADAGTLAEIQATTAGAGYNNATDSLEAIRDRGDAAWTTGSGGGGAGSGQYAVPIRIRDAGTSNPVAGAAVTILSSGTVIAFINSPANGLCSFALDNGTYTINVSATNYTPQTGLSLVVSGVPGSTRNIDLAPITIPTPSAPSTCAVSCPVFRGATPVKSATVTAELESKASGNSTGVQLTLVANVRTDNSGVAILQLPWSAGYTSGNGVYRIKAMDPQTGMLAYERRVTVPSLSTANISSLPTAP